MRPCLAILVLVGLVGGCAQPAVHRYATFPLPPAQVRSDVRQLAEAAGMTAVAPPTCSTTSVLGCDPPSDDIDKYVIELDEHTLRRPAVSLAAAGAHRMSLAGHVLAPITARTVASADGGSVLEIASPTAALAEELAPTGRTYRGVDSSWWNDPVFWDLTVDGGFSHTPHTDRPWRMDMMFRLGGRVWAAQHSELGGSWRHRASVFVGGGMEVDSEGVARGEIGVSLDRQRVVTPMPATMIPQSRRRAIDLSLAGRRGLESNFNGAELGVTLHVPPYGGLFARGGYEWGHTSGPTVFAGARLDTKPAVLVVGFAMVALLTVGAKYIDWGALLPTPE